MRRGRIRGNIRSGRRRRGTTEKKKRKKKRKKKKNQKKKKKKKKTYCILHMANFSTRSQTRRATSERKDWTRTTELPAAKDCWRR
jgi:hypothetical protein